MPPNVVGKLISEILPKSLPFLGSETIVCEEPDIIFVFDKRDELTHISLLLFCATPHHLSREPI